MEDFKIERIVLGMVSTNCYFVYKEKTGEAIVFDPADQGEQIYELLQENHITVKAIMLTHGHFDHIMGVKALQQLSGCKVYAAEEEKDLLENASLNCSNQIGRPYTLSADNYSADLQILDICGFRIQVIHTPGHTKGSTCYYFINENILISGDTLFETSIGRTDLPTGSQSALIHSIKDKLFILDDNVKVYPGHGEETTIGYEKKYNPYCC